MQWLQEIVLQVSKNDYHVDVHLNSTFFVTPCFVRVLWKSVLGKQTLENHAQDLYVFLSVEYVSQTCMCFCLLYVCAHRDTSVHACLHTHTHTLTCTHMKQTHTPTVNVITQTHSHLYIYIYTHTHTQFCIEKFFEYFLCSFCSTGEYINLPDSACGSHH